VVVLRGLLDRTYTEPFRSHNSGIGELDGAFLNVLNMLPFLRDREFTEPTPESPCVRGVGRGQGWGMAEQGAAESGVLRSGVGMSSVPPMGRFGGAPAAVVECVGSGQDFGQHVRSGKLKNWKSEKLTARSLAQIARIPDFQDFRFSLTPDTPEILPVCPAKWNWGGGECPECACETGHLGPAYINICLTAENDPFRKYRNFAARSGMY